MSLALGAPVRAACQVRGLRRQGAYHVLALTAPEVAREAQPGQFVAVAAPSHTFALRRPFSLHRARAGTIELAFSVIGSGTAALAELRPGASVDVLGPLGRPFREPEHAGVPCLLVGGGYGAAPLLWLAEWLAARGRPAHLVIGAASAERLFDPEGAARSADSVTLTTEDGSAGHTGLVTDVLPELSSRLGIGAVYACGPMAMLAAVGRLAAAAGLPCQVAVEERMACGTGICFSCVIPVRSAGASPPTRMARACTEGPVLDGSAVAWEELGL